MEPENQPPDNSPPQLGFNPQETSRITGMSESWLSKARMGITASPGPKFKKVGRKVIYTLSSIQAWLHN